MKRRNCFISFVFFFAAVLSGCGGGAGNDGSNINVIGNPGGGNANPLAVETRQAITGKIAGKISVPTEYSNKGAIRAYIPGTTFSANGDETGSFTIFDVPAGSYSVICEAPGLMPFQINGVGVDMQKTTNMGLVMLQMMGSQGTEAMQGMMNSQGATGMQWMMGN